MKIFDRNYIIRTIGILFALLVFGCAPKSADSDAKCTAEGNYGAGKAEKKALLLSRIAASILQSDPGKAEKLFEKAVALLEGEDVREEVKTRVSAGMAKQWMEIDSIKARRPKSASIMRWTKK